MDEQIMIWDTKRPKRKPWITSQATLNQYHQWGWVNFQKYSDLPQEPNIIEVKKNVAVVVPEIIVAKKPAVVEVIKPVERKVTTTKIKRGRPKKK